MTAFLAPISPAHLDQIPPGTEFVGVAHSNRAQRLEDGKITGFSAFLTLIVDGMGIANAIVLLAQAILLPVKSLVFS